MMEKPVFDSVLRAVLMFTVLLLVIDATLTIGVGTPTASQADLIAAARSGWHMGFSALVGLMGGKALA